MPEDDGLGLTATPPTPPTPSFLLHCAVANQDRRRRRPFCYYAFLLSFSYFSSFYTFWRTLHFLLNRSSFFFVFFNLLAIIRQRDISKEISRSASEYVFWKKRGEALAITSSSESVLHMHTISMRETHEDFEPLLPCTSFTRFTMKWVPFCRCYRMQKAIVVGRFRLAYLLASGRAYYFICRRV